eukprot:7775_1
MCVISESVQMFPQNREMDLHPPRLSISRGTEVSLCPGGEDDLSGLVSGTVGKSKGKRGGSTKNGSSIGVLRSMAWAHELVVGSRPWDNTSQVSAHGVKAVGLKRSIILNDKVCGISLQSLSKGMVTRLLAGKVVLLNDLISKGILGGGSATSTSSSRGKEEEYVRDSKSSNSDSSRSDEDQVHEVSAVLVNVKFTLSGVHAHGNGRATLLDIDGGRGEGGGGADEGGGKDGEKLHSECIFLLMTESS